MNHSLQFDPTTNQLTGPAGSLPIASNDELARRFLMLLEGQCLEARIGEVAQKFGCCRQRYYQLLEAFQKGGLSALAPQKTGPKSKFRRTEEIVRQILRHRFLDPDASVAVVAQKLRQTHLSISVRSVERVIADYGLQKKTLRAEPEKSSSHRASGTGRKTPAPGKGRRGQPGTGSSPDPGR
ncbi:MAG TPA: helix-turn-helix domain-containing protein [Verrucomicrobiae bacterium]|nr:helix-turn-helix domain-containing protein [Verrucomicrobiae bacterium]